MNIFFEDWDGSQMPRSKVKNAGVVAERYCPRHLESYFVSEPGITMDRYAGPTRALDRLIGCMDKGMAKAMESRLLKS